MPLSRRQKQQLLLADRGYDASAVMAAIAALTRENDTATLLDCEMALRDAAAWSFLVAVPGAEFEVLGGTLAMCGRLAGLGVTLEQNRERLAAARTVDVATLVG